MDIRMADTAILDLNYNITRTGISALEFERREPRSGFLGGVTPRLNHA
jgi:hypothetical protein